MVMVVQTRMSDEDNIMQNISSLIEETIIATLASLYDVKRNNIEILNCKQTKFHNFARIRMIYEGFSQWGCEDKDYCCWFQLIQSNKDKFGRYHWTFDAVPYLPYNVSNRDGIQELRNVEVQVTSVLLKPDQNKNSLEDTF